MRLDLTTIQMSLAILNSKCSAPNDMGTINVCWKGAISKESGLGIKLSVSSIMEQTGCVQIYPQLDSNL
jgi:hypothetical protein